MKRRKWTTLQRAGIFLSHGGKCYICGDKIDGVKSGFDLDHEIPLELGGDDTEENMRPICRPCHKIKTAKDVAKIAKAKRIEAKHIGARNPATLKSRGFQQWEPNTKQIHEEFSE